MFIDIGQEEFWFDVTNIVLGLSAVIALVTICRLVCREYRLKHNQIVKASVTIGNRNILLQESDVISPPDRQRKSLRRARKGSRHFYVTENGELVSDPKKKTNDKSSS